jgi:quinoprotein glucose dehydrogenase
VYRITPPGLAEDATAAEVKKPAAAGFADRRTRSWPSCYHMPTKRVRQNALVRAGRGGRAVATLRWRRPPRTTRLGRVHAIWGLGRIGKGNSAAALALVPLLTDGEPEIRAQAARVLGDTDAPAAVEPLTKLLKDRSARVQFAAAMSLGKLGSGSAADAVLAMLKKNNDRDAYLRHAGVMALAGMNDPKVLDAAATDASSAVRVAALLVYRRQASPQVARFLDDADPSLVLEAARAVNDLTITPALPKLAALSAKPGLAEPVLNRAINAHYRLGGADNATALAAFAARSDVPPATRVEAIRMLAAWEKPSGRDRVTGLWRPVPPRDAGPAKAALAGVLDGLLKEAPDAVRIAA